MLVGVWVMCGCPSANVQLYCHLVMVFGSGVCVAADAFKVRVMKLKSATAESALPAVYQSFVYVAKVAIMQLA